MADNTPDDVFKLFDLEDDEQPVSTGGAGPANTDTVPVTPAGDTADSWSQITGNAELVRVLKALVTSREPQTHVLVYGPNRSGKTFSVHTALKAKFCRERRDDLEPCNRCKSCRTWESGAWNRIGFFRNREGHDFKYSWIDGTNPSTIDEELACRYRDRGCPLVLYIDEVSDPEFLKFMPRLIKPMTETPMTIIASGVRLGGRKDPVTGARFPGLSKDFVYRFTSIVKTTAPAPPDFRRWLSGEVVRRGLAPDDAVLDLIIEQAGHIPGQALRPLRAARFLGVPLTLAFVESYRWEV